MDLIKKLITIMSVNQKEQYLNNALDLSDLERRMKEVEIAEVRDADIKMRTYRI